MDVFEAINTRRSIRKFEQRDIPEETVRDILAAAMMAPSAGNAQPWQFVLVTDRARLEAVGTINPYAKMAAQAPLGILVCGDLGKEKYAGYWVQDCSAATQNLLLAAHAKGLGAVWTGIHPMQDREEGFRKLFELPEGIIPLGFMVLGWPGQHPESKDRFNPERVHREVYGG